MDAVWITVVLLAIGAVLLRLMRGMSPDIATVTHSSRSRMGPQVRQAANRARTELDAADARLAEQHRLQTERLRGEYATGANRVAADLENKVLWLAIASKVSDEKKREFHHYVAAKARHHLPDHSRVDQALAPVRAWPDRAAQLANQATASVRSGLPQHVSRPLDVPGVAAQPGAHGISLRRIAGGVGEGAGLGLAAVAISDGGTAMKVAEFIVAQVNEAALEVAEEILVEEFGEELAEELAETAAAILFPGLGWIFAGWKAVKYGSKIKRIFFDQEPLQRVRASVRSTIQQHGNATVDKIQVDGTLVRTSVTRQIRNDLDNWEQDALRLAA